MGNIGRRVARRVQGFEVKEVLYHDLVAKPEVERELGVRRVPLDELLAQSDIVSLHVPETPQTANMIAEPQLRMMRKGSFLINNSRGTVVDLDALAAALKSGHLAGAAVDVFPVEPASNKDRFNTPLQGIDNVILTPHIGGSTEEAQERIGAEVARKLVEYSDAGSTVGAVNFPQVQLPSRATGTRFIHVHQNVPGMMNALNQIFSRHGVNIASQYLQTEGDLGYVVVEADGCSGDAEAVLDEMKAIPGTIRARLLYAS
jgi:D-3-phosphoglycerate dehydrogenase